MSVTDSERLDSLKAFAQNGHLFTNEEARWLVQLVEDQQAVIRDLQQDSAAYQRGLEDARNKEHVKDALEALTDEERLSVMRDWCSHRGGCSPCNCMRDD